MSVDPLRQVLDDNVARIEAHAPLSDVAVLAYTADTTTEELAKRLGVAKGRSGKVGAAILVMLPTLSVETPNLPGPQFVARASFLVVVHPELNAGTIGAKKTAGEIARELVRLFHHARTSRFLQSWNAGADAVVPNTGLGKLVGFDVELSALWGQETVARVPTPTITGSSASPATVSIACADGAAAIWYTTDGSYPAPANTAATLYSAPLALPACTLRAAAYRSAYQPSSVTEQTIS